MKMNLKNNNIKKRLINFNNIKLNSKNFLIFLLSFTIISLILGIIFYYIMSSSDKSEVNDVLINTFKIKDKYEYLKLLKENISSNSSSLLIIWILGISIIGVIVNIFLYFCEIFSVGFTIAALVNTYKIKSIIGILVYLFPGKIIYIISMFIVTYSSTKFSYKIIKSIFLKNDIDLKKEINKYFKILIFSSLIIIVISILNVFITPFLIKFFTKI